MQDKYQLKNLPDAALIKNLETLSLRENEATLEILLQLIELEDRKLHLTLGFGSLFAYCRENLKYSEGAANRRIKVARCIRAYPKVYELLKDCRVSLSTVCIFSAVLTHENQDELLAQAAGLGQAEVEKLVASYREPTERARDVVRVVSKGECAPKGGFPHTGQGPGCPPAKSQRPLAFTAPSALVSAEASESLPEAPAAETPKGEVIQRYSFSAGDQFEKTLIKMRALLSNKHPRGVLLEDLFLEAMSFYLKAHEPKVKFRGAVKAAQIGEGAVTEETDRDAAEDSDRDLAQKLPSPAKSDVSIKARPRHIPVAVKAKVYKRDGACCSFIGLGGRKCGSRWELEFDHVLPFAMGGESTVDNLRLVCRSHNQLQAERAFGREHVAYKIQESRRGNNAAAAANL